MKCYLFLFIALISFNSVVYGADAKPALVMMFGNEGGLTKDNGGWTNFGISQNGSGKSEVQIKALTIDTATAWYLVNVWKPLMLDKMPSQIIANEIFDSAVNEGTGTAARRIQQAINLSNGLKSDIKIDGVLGRCTWVAFAQCDQIEFYVNWIILRGYRYQTLATKNPTKFEQYYKTWLYRMKDNVRQAVHEYDAKRRK